MLLLGFGEDECEFLEGFVECGWEWEEVAVEQFDDGVEGVEELCEEWRLFRDVAFVVTVRFVVSQVLETAVTVCAFIADLHVHATFVFL